jgi:hypothetical protein
MEESGWWSTWEELEELMRRLKLNTVPVLFNGIVEDNFYELMEALCHGKSVYGEEEKEGIVIWPFSGMGDDSDFSQDTAKWVRADHPENPDEHWMYKPVERQGVINVGKSIKRRSSQKA